MRRPVPQNEEDYDNEITELDDEFGEAFVFDDETTEDAEALGEDDLEDTTAIENELAALAPLPAAEPNIRTARAGTGRPEDNPDAEDGEIVLDFHKLYSSLQVNWRAAASYPVLGRRPRRAALINWKAKDLQITDQMSGLYSLIPRLCPGMERDINPRAIDPIEDDRTPIEDRTGPLLCPCARRFNANTDIWKDMPCPNEILTGWRHFVNYIRELKISASDHVDVQQVVEICKLHIYEGRCDEELQVAGNIHDLASPTIDQKTGAVYWNKKTPAAIETQKQLSDRRDKLFKNLVASRSEKDRKRVSEMKAAAAVGEAGASMTFAEMTAALAKSSVRNRRALQAAQDAEEAEDVIDAEIVTARRDGMAE